MLRMMLPAEAAIGSMALGFSVDDRHAAAITSICSLCGGGRQIFHPRAGQGIAAGDGRSSLGGFSGGSAVTARLQSFPEATCMRHCRSGVGGAVIQRLHVVYCHAVHRLHHIAALDAGGERTAGKTS